MRSLIVTVAMLALFSGCAQSTLADENSAIAKQGSMLVHKYCYGCHNADDDYYNILDHDQLLEEKYVVKGELSKSAIWERISDKEEPMPPEDEPQPTKAEVETIKKWLLAGAPLISENAIEKALASGEDHGDENIDRLGSIVMKKYCYDCHGGKATKARLDVFAKDLDEKYTGGGDLSKSKMWRQVESKKMPKRGSPMPSDQEIELIRRWIENGAVVDLPTVQKREFVTVKSEIESISDDLDKMREQDRKFVRYFSLRNVHNNYQRYTDSDLNAHQAALAKVVNSLSWSSEIVPPTKVDELGTLWRIDLRDYEWHQPRFQQQYHVSRIGVWNLLCTQYPYGLSHLDSRDQRIRDMSKEISNYMELRGQFPVLRADWFCFEATQSDMYYLIMGIQPNVRDLERDLGLNLERDFRNRELNRFALKESGVSVGNRLMDRHVGSSGYYWISYDFKEGGARNDLRRFPLGPTYPSHPHPEFAFKHDGGELIFSMNNGMQGYALTDDVGGLLREGPIEVVQDAFQATGDATVTNAISCMKCHASGMKPFEDDIRDTIALRSGDPLRFAEDLYDPRGVLEKTLEKDGKKFIDAFKECLEGVVEFEPRWLEPNTEPVGILANKYMSPLDAFDAASELEFAERENAGLYFRDSALFEFGLRSLSQGQVVKRSEWDSRNEGGDSIFQKAATTLEVAESTTYRSSKIESMIEAFRKQTN